jgi:hypothetical protein
VTDSDVVVVLNRRRASARQRRCDWRRYRVGQNRGERGGNATGDVKGEEHSARVSMSCRRMRRKLKRTRRGRGMKQTLLEGAIRRSHPDLENLGVLIASLVGLG